jgi:hypothetical protein
MSERVSSEARTARPWVSPAIAIAVVPFVGYLMAYAREYGYALYFDLPRQLISVDLIASLRLAAGLLFFAAVILNWGTALYPFVQEGKAGRRVLDSMLGPGAPGLIILPLGAMLIFGIRNWIYWIWFWSIPVLWFVIDLILALVFGRGAGSLRAKLQAHRERGAKERMFSDAVGEAIGQRALGLLFLLLVLVIAYGVRGYSDALNQRDFLVAPVDRDAVVLRIYGDTVVAARLRPGSRHISKQLLVWKIGPTTLVLEKRHLGRLKGP